MNRFAFSDAADAYHRLGKYDEELAVARQMKAGSPGSHLPLRLEARALVGLGRLDELESLVAKVEMTPTAKGYGGASILHVGMYLRAHGYQAESVEMAERAATWYRTSAFRDEGSVMCEKCLADCLMVAGRIEEAWEIFARLCEPDNPDGPWVHFAIASARLGDVEFVWQMIDNLERHEEEQGEPGATAFDRAVLLAELGEREEALRLLKEAIASGFSEYMWLHNQLMFEPLREDPEFQGIVRPKG
jgi:tetratricopeptide (TPR) repeat protein